METDDGKFAHTFTEKTPKFEFPFANDNLSKPLLILSDLRYRSSMFLRYRGSMDSGFVLNLYILEPIDRLSVKNNTTNAKLELDFAMVKSVIGGPPVAGDRFEISTIRGERSVRFYRKEAKRWYNLFNCVKRWSKWPILVKGENHIKFDVTETESTSVTTDIHYYQLHLRI